MRYIEIDMSFGQHLRCDYEYVKITDTIIYIRDLNKTGRMSVTNDADEVYRIINKVVYPGRRVVYQDSEGEWSEMVEQASGNWLSDFSITFKPWHGEVWDILSKESV